MPLLMDKWLMSHTVPDMAMIHVGTVYIEQIQILKD